ncbi:MAG: AAA family ATPase [Solirubrobacterales bacterium]|nr:AAA family ATPase [Solirubrobacterales bacterium]
MATRQRIARTTDLNPPLTWPLVARSQELERIETARADGSVGVLIQGSAGVGKSRLAREALARAERHHALTGWVQATRSAAGVALGAFAAVLPPEVRSDDPFQLIQRASEALRSRAGGRALVLALDDAQWLDPVSATLALHLATTTTAFVVATVRTGEPCPDAIVSLWKDANAPRLELGSLSGPETEALVEAMIGGPVEREARHWIRETSAGNALYVRELVRGALAGGALKLVGGLWRMPARPPTSASLTELVTARLADLTRDQQRALELLALGEPLRASEMSAVIGSEPLSSVQERGLVTVEGATPDAEVRLSHPLYGEVIRAGLPSLRARELRLALAETMQARGSLGAEDTLRLARWLTDAGESMPADLLIRAARAANFAGDPGFGAALASHALTAGAGIEATLLLARAYAARSLFEEAEAVLAGAEGSIQTQQQAIEYLERQTEVLYWGLGRPSELRVLLDRAAGWWPDAAWRGRLEPLRVRLDSFQWMRLGVEASMELLAQADLQAEVRHELEPAHLANLFFRGRTREAHQLALRIRPTLPVRNLADSIALALWTRITLEDGERWSELESWMTCALDAAVRLADHATAGQAAYSLACLRALSGRYLDAAALLAEAEAQLERHDPMALLAVISAQQVCVACFTGDRVAMGAALEQCHARLAQGAPLAHQLPYVVRADAWAAYAEGEHERGQQLLLDAAQDLSASPVHAASLTYEAMRVGAHPRRLVKALDDLRQRCDARLVAAYAAHASARAARNGPALLSTAEEMAQIGALRYATEAAAHAAQAFLNAGRQDSARRAAARSRELFARDQGGMPPPVEGLDQSAIELTAREAQLVQMAAQGLTNAQIAERLVLSVRTVESHLYRAMRKLGVNDRRELASLQHAGR